MQHVSFKLKYMPGIVTWNLSVTLDTPMATQSSGEMGLAVVIKHTVYRIPDAVERGQTPRVVVKPDLSRRQR